MWNVINRRGFLRKLDRRRCSIVRRTSANGGSYGLENVKPSPVPDVVKLPARLPFLKSLYAGQYDVEVLTYPETLNLERYKDLEARVQQVRSNCTSVDTIRQLGLFGMSAPYPCSGLNLTDTEIARVFEHFDYDSFGLVHDHTLAVDVIKTYGTPDQRAKYLPLLASGAACSLHKDCGGVRAVRLPDQNWELTGTVENNSAADAYTLFVVGNAAFLLEKDKLLVDDERLELSRVIVPAADVLDNVDLTKITGKGHVYTCALLVTSLAKVLRSTIMSVLPKTRLNMKLREFDSVLKTLGKSILNLYTVESMIYLTTWMTDGFDGPDVELETAAVQLYVRQTAYTTLNELKMLSGRNSTREPFVTMCNEVEDLIDSLEGTTKLANFISGRGVEFFHKSEYKENISFVTQAYRNIMMKRGEPSLKYGLQQFLHPALMVMSLKLYFLLTSNLVNTYCLFLVSC